MLDKKMNLKEMIEFNYDEEVFSLLPIDVMSVTKLVICASSKENAYRFIQFMFNDKNINTSNKLFKDVLKTAIYDFNTPNKFIVICELLGIEPQADISKYFEELLTNYEYEEDIICDTYDDDSNLYRTSRYNEVIKTSLIKAKIN